MGSRSGFPWTVAALLPWFLSASAPAGAQAITDCGQGCSPTPFACGGEIAGELTAADCKEGARFADVHDWDQTSPVEAELHIRAVGFTPRLLLLVKPEGFRCITVAESAACEPAEPGSACLRSKVFAGRLLLVVTSEEDGATGSYTIRSSCGPLRCDPACRRGSIACGATVSGNLGAGAGCAAASGGAFDSWDFDVPARSRVRIQATSASPLLASIHYPDFFTGRNCLELASPRLCAPGSCIDLILEPGAMHISIAAPAPGGAYDLTVTCEEFDACAGCPIVGSVRCGSDVASRLGPEDCETGGMGEEQGYRTREERWTFDVAAAGLYKVSADAAEGFVNARLVLRDGCGSLFVPVDPCPGSAADTCAVYHLEPGAYFVTAWMFEPGEPPPLDYSLSIDCIDLGPCRDCLRGALACGSRAAGRLAPGAGCVGADGAPLDVWSFTLDGAPADVTFTARSSAFVPRIVLLDSLCETLASDACVPGPGAACATVLAGGPRTVFVGVTSGSAAASGDYEIEVACEPFSLCAPRCSEGTLRSGEAATGELAGDDCAPDPSTRADAWTYTQAAPGMVEVLVDAQGFTPRVQVLDGSCEPLPIEGGVLGTFGRGAVNLDAGTFRIVVQNDFSSPGALGPYTVRVRPFPDCGACPGASPAPCAEDGTLSGDFGPGDCTDADGFIYDVHELDLPTVRDVRLSSRPGVDVFLWAFREGCAPRLAFLSGGFGLGVLLEAGKYRFVVSSFAPGTFGSYSVSFSCREAAFCDPRCIAGTITCGQPAPGTLTEEDCDFFATILDVWRLDVPRGGASIRVGSPGPIFFGAFPAACNADARLDQHCARDESGAFFCDLAPGSYLLNVTTSRNVILQQGPQPYTIEVTTSACGRFGDQLPGDCNQDGKLDLADGVCLLSHLFRGEPSVLSCEAGGLGLSGRSLLDWNGDRELNLTDPIALLVHLFQSGVPHVLGSECVPGAGCPGTCGG